MNINIAELNQTKWLIYKSEDGRFYIMNATNRYIYSLYHQPSEKKKFLHQGKQLLTFSTKRSATQYLLDRHTKDNQIVGGSKY